MVLIQAVVSGEALSFCSLNTLVFLKYTYKTLTGFMRYCEWTRGHPDILEFSFNDGDASDSKNGRLIGLKSINIPHSTVLHALIFLLLFYCFVRWSLT